MQGQRRRFMPDKDAQEQQCRFAPGKTKEQPSKRNVTQDPHQLAENGRAAPLSFELLMNKAHHEGYWRQER
jgi:hypothetical protein